MSSPSNFKIKIKNSNKPYSSVLMLCIYTGESECYRTAAEQPPQRVLCVASLEKPKNEFIFSIY
jgi:hypothetical protein